MNIGVLIYVAVCFLYWGISGEEDESKFNNESLNAFLRDSRLFFYLSIFLSFFGSFSGTWVNGVIYFLGSIYWLIIYKINFDEANRRLSLYRENLLNDFKKMVSDKKEEKNKKGGID